MRQENAPETDSRSLKAISNRLRLEVRTQHSKVKGQDAGHTPLDAAWAWSHSWLSNQELPRDKPAKSHKVTALQQSFNTC